MLEMAALASLFQFAAAMLGLTAMFTVTFDRPSQIVFRLFDLAMATVVPIQGSRWQSDTSRQNCGQ